MDFYRCSQDNSCYQAEVFSVNCFCRQHYFGCRLEMLVNPEFCPAKGKTQKQNQLDPPEQAAAGATRALVLRGDPGAGRCQAAEDELRRPTLRLKQLVVIGW
nr:uncharacterized protein LOC102094456 [Columba livia]